MDKVVSKEALLRQVDGLRDIIRRARRLAEIANEANAPHAVCRRIRGKRQKDRRRRRKRQDGRHANVSHARVQELSARPAHPLGP